MTSTSPRNGSAPAGNGARWLSSVRPVLLPSTLLFSIAGYCLNGFEYERPGALFTSVAAAVLVHIGGYLMNDLVDVKIDRTDASRQTDPVASGALTPRTVAAMVALTYLLAAAVGVIWCPIRVQLCLIAAVACTTVYNLYGKRCPIPPVTDFVQGLAWALLLVASASWESLRMSALLAGLGLAIYIMMVNGFQGALRDHRNDIRHGARTTATVYAGLTIGATDMLPSGYVLYGLTLTAFKTGALAAAAIVYSGSLPKSTPTGPLIALFVFETAGAMLFVAAARSYHQAQSGERLGFAQLLAFPLSLLSIVWLSLGPVIYGVAVAVYLGAWFGSRTVRSLAPGPVPPMKVSSR